MNVAEISLKNKLFPTDQSEAFLNDLKENFNSGNKFKRYYQSLKSGKTCLNDIQCIINKCHERECFESEDYNKIILSIKTGKFEKKVFSNFLDHSIIIGDDEGLYDLLNSLNEEEIAFLKKNNTIEEEYLISISEKISKLKKKKIQ